MPPMKFTDRANGDKWTEYVRTRDPQLRNELVVLYRGKARAIAETVLRRLPECVDRAELESAVDRALLDVVERFDPERGVKFETFMAPRIRGAIKDRLRDLDPISRGVRAAEAARRLAEAALWQELQRGPTDEELIERLGWTSQQLAASRPCNIGSIEHPVTRTEDGLEVPLRELLAKLRPARNGEYFFLRVTGGLEYCERMVLYLHFYKQCTLVEIANVLRISEGRACQLKQSGLKWIRDTRGTQEILQQFEESRQKSL